MPDRQKDIGEKTLESYSDIDATMPMRVMSCDGAAYRQQIADGERQGYAKGTAAGIIKTGRKYGASDSSIVGDLVDALSCTRDEAERMLRDAHE